jgi:hypothetical protein
VRRILLPLALLSLAAALSGCGVASTIDPVAGAATKSQQTGSAKVTMAIAVEADGTTYSVTGAGAFARDRGEMTFDMARLLKLAGLPSSAGGDVKLLYLPEDGDSVVYLQLPFLTGELTGGKTWIRVDLQKAAKALGFDLSDLLGPTNQNPGDLLDMLRASSQLDEVGKDTIDGTPTTHYKGTLDLEQAAKLKGISAETVARLKAAGAPTEVPVEVWVGDDGLVRQLRMVEDMASAGKKTNASVTVGFTDYGTDVSVDAPPADEVFDATALAGLASQLGTTKA